MTDASQPPERQALVYRNRPGLPGLVLKNMGLNLVTLWFYRFWAKAAWRKHVWSNVSLLGDPIEFTGTGLEMFKGFLFALAFLAPFFIVFGVWEAMVAEGGLGLWIEQVTYFATLYALIVAASFYARRYRLSRTRWRGTPLVLDAKFGDYLKFYLRTQALNTLTLFVMNPRAAMAIEAWLVSRTRLGAVRFECAPDWRPLMTPWLTVLAGVFATLSLAWGWIAGRFAGLLPSFGVPAVHFGVVASVALFAVCAFVAYRIASLRIVAGAASLNGARFASSARAAPVIAYFVVGFFALLIAYFFVDTFLYFLRPLNIPPPLNLFVQIGFLAITMLFGFALIRDAWVAPWIVDHVVNSTTISNPEALAAIAAGAEDPMTRGEGLADSFDVGIG